MKPPLHTDSDSRFLEAVGYLFCVSAVVFGGLALTQCPVAENSSDTGSDTGSSELPLEDYSFHCKRKAPEDFNRLVNEAGKESGINPRVIALTVYRESKCDSHAVGVDGEIGLGQIYPAIWTDVLTKEEIIASVDDLYDPEVNLRATGFILSESLRYAKGDPVDALRRYNGSGPAANRYAREQVSLYKSLWGESVWFRDG